VRGAQRILVTFADGRDAEATLIGADAATDVAVLKIEGGRLTPVSIGRAEEIRIGERVIAFGSPFGNLLSNAEPTVTVGVTSAVNRHLVSSGEDGGYYLGMIQTDAAINPGNSGGPLANADGEVIGMNTSIFSQSGGSEGMGFAIPIERALRIAKDLQEHGRVRRAWVGIRVEPLEADEFGRMLGVRVSQVAPGSPGDRAGIRVGDVLLEVNGKRMLTLLDYQAALIDMRADDEVFLRMDGGWAPVSTRAVELPSLHAEKVRIFGGLEITTLTESIGVEFGVTSQRGVLVMGVTEQFQAALRGNTILPGDVILAVNNRPVSTHEELVSLVSGLPRNAWHSFTIERDGGTGPADFFLSR
jgi:serine protease Do